MKPSWRKPAGMLFLLIYITLWSIGAVSLWPAVVAQHWTVQALYFAVAGLVWIVPLGPLLRWMETGRLRRADR